jgi:hypothetical protein
VRNSAANLVRNGNALNRCLLRLSKHKAKYATKADFLIARIGTKTA